MTIIKQVAITSTAHLKSLRSYLDTNNEKHEVLAVDSQYLSNESKWEDEMRETRETYGHNVSGKAGAKCTYMYHQILAFNADDHMTPQACMDYAKEYIQERYPNQEAIWVLHKEHCAADNTNRYAVHIAINRTNLYTGLRLNDGLAKQAKIERANTIRDMDRRWGLKEVQANKRNCELHARQPSKAEQEMLKRGVVPIKEQMRQTLRNHIREISRMERGNKVRTLAEKLQNKGIKMSLSKDKSQLKFEQNGLYVNGVKLGRGFSMEGILHGLGVENKLEEKEEISFSEQEGMRM